MSRSTLAPRPVVLAASVRTIPRPVVGIACVAAIPTLVIAVRGGDDFSGALTAASLIAGVGAGYTADDPAAPTLASTPTTLATRRIVRGLLIALILGTGWTAAVVTAYRFGTTPPEVSMRLAELFAAAAVSAAFASRARTDAPVNIGAAAAAASLLAVVTVSALAIRWPGLPTLRTTPAHDRWWLLAAAGLAIAGWSSRDPASRFRVDRIVRT
jgi:hypothetical protein